MRGGQGQDHGEEGSAARGGGVGGRGEDFVRVGQVVEEGHEDEKEAHAKGHACEHGGREGDGGLGGPAEPEERGDEEGTPNAGEREAAVFLAADPGVAAGLGAEEDGVPGVEDGEGEAGASGDGQVGETRDAGGEAVDVLEDEGEGLEGHVEDGVDEGEVGASGGDDRFEEEHAEGPGEDHGEETAEVRLLEVAWGDGAGGRVGGAELAGAAGEEDGPVRLWEERGEEEGEAGEDEGDPEAPAPADGFGREARDDGGEDRAKCGGLKI